jgi:hypothetical protein
MVKTGDGFPGVEGILLNPTFGRSFHFDPGMSLGFLFGATRHKLSEGKCPANYT